ncbi:hypothetical protein LTR92_010437 [Exophiala xenobiotica]|nr:hypothetical protein LTR92_010437 [Exophiala xenobiotica]KAK5341864.1 hypothetical protein LTR98_002658 [Exophiala xenobiotica]
MAVAAWNASCEFKFHVRGERAMYKTGSKVHVREEGAGREEEGTSALHSRADL